MSKENIELLSRLEFDVGYIQDLSSKFSKKELKQLLELAEANKFAETLADCKNFQKAVNRYVERQVSNSVGGIKATLAKMEEPKQSSTLNGLIEALGD